MSHVAIDEDLKGDYLKPRERVDVLMTMNGVPG